MRLVRFFDHDVKKDGSRGKNKRGLFFNVYRTAFTWLDISILRYSNLEVDEDVFSSDVRDPWG